MANDRTVAKLRITVTTPSTITTMPVRLGQFGITATMQIIEVDPENRFDKLSAMEHDTDVLRSVQINKCLYMISDTQFIVHVIDYPSQLIAETQI